MCVNSTEITTTDSTGSSADCHPPYLREFAAFLLGIILERMNERDDYCSSFATSASESRH